MLLPCPRANTPFDYNIYNVIMLTLTVGFPKNEKHTWLQMVNHMYNHGQIAQIGQHELQAFVDLYFILFRYYVT